MTINKKHNYLKFIRILLIIGFCAVIFFIQFNYCVYYIPTASMEDALLCGDYIIVKKEMFEKVRLDKNKRIRNKVKRGDIIVFNSSEQQDINLYAKRCIAIPGDTVYIKRDSIFINNRFQKFPESAKFLFYVKTRKKNELLSYADSCGINTIIFGSGNIRVCTNTSMIQKLISESLIEEAKPINRSAQNGAFKFHGLSGFTIPKIGDTVIIDSISQKIYGKTYTLNEKQKETIGNNYYYVMGDNRHVSIDSRSFGVISESQIIGKAIFIIYSSAPNNTGIRGIRFNRILKKIQ